MSKQYLISDFLKRIKRPIELENKNEYKLLTIKMKHNGVTLREKKIGAEIKSNMYLVKTGDFILSGIDARNGAFGIIPEELNNAIVTNDFWYFEINENIILKELFLELTETTWFDEICKRGSDGTTQRIRLQKEKFFNQSVWLPEKNNQKSILSKIKLFKQNLGTFTQENVYQNKMLEKFHQSTLQEAIQGKLTAEWRKQNPCTEPATELLKRIKIDKEQLIKEKKIKKEKPLPPIVKGEIPFELPENWVWCHGSDIFKPMETKLPIGKIFGYIDIAAIDNKNHKLIKPRYVPVEEAPSRASRTIYGGSTLFSLVRPYLGNIAYVDDKYSYCIASTGFFVCTPYNGIYPKYLYCLMISNYVIQGLNKFMKGVNSPSINTDDVLNFKYPIPPFYEQQVIVERAETLLEKCNQLQTEIEIQNKYSKDLLKALFNETFGGHKSLED